MKDLQTPKKETLRSQNLATRRSKESPLKTPHKIVKKSLNAVINTEDEYFSPEAFRDSMDPSPVSEISNPSNDGKIDDRSVSALSETSLDTDVTPSSKLISCITEPVDDSEWSVSALSEKSLDTNITPTSKVICCSAEPVDDPESSVSALSETSLDTDGTATSKLISSITELADDSEVIVGFGKPNDTKCSSVEVEAIANLLIEARSQVLNSFSGDLRSKRLLDALVGIVVDEFYAMPNEKDSLLQHVTTKGICLFIVGMALALSTMFFFRFGAQVTSFHPPPT